MKENKEENKTTLSGIKEGCEILLIEQHKKQS